MQEQKIIQFNKLSTFNIKKYPKYPILFPHAFSESNAVKCWTPDYLSSLLGDKIVQVGKSQDGVHRLDPKKGVPKGGVYSMPFNEYIRKITSDENEAKTLYLQQAWIQDLMPSLHEDIDIITKTFNNETFSFPQLWVGTSHSLVPLHFDQPNNFLMQIYGEKHLLLFSPKQSKYLYMQPFYSRIVHTSQIDTYIDKNNPNASKFPKLQEAEYIEVVLKAGDVLYIPPYWWHQVQGLSLNISVTYRWESKFHQTPLYFHLYWLAHRCHKKLRGYFTQE